MLRVRWSHQGREEVRTLSRDEVRIGRGAENEIVLPDYSVSRRHASLTLEPEGWAIQDHGSTNGVQVNRVTVKRALVRPGDRIKIGIFELDVEDVPEARSPIFEPRPIEMRSPFRSETLGAIVAPSPSVSFRRGRTCV